MKTERLLLLAVAITTATTLPAQTTPVSQMERLDRGVVALPAAQGGNFISWRLLGTDDADRTTFGLLRNGQLLADGLTVTNFTDKSGTPAAQYQVITHIDALPADTTPAVRPWSQQWLKLPLDLPAKGAANGGTYTPNDCSAGDVDGDGQYEIFVKWDPSNAKDNSQGGVTDNVLIDCYRLDGTRLWRVDLGRNIRAGAHYTQYMVYDFDGDGRCEMICKTAPNSRDGQGQFVNQAATDQRIRSASNTKSWVTTDGRINGGHEYLTVFRGIDGQALHTIAYNPTRNAKSELSEAEGTFNWDDRSGKNDKGSYGNRGERYLAAVACLDADGSHASAIFCRGYYTYAYIWAVDFDGQHLKPRWLHRSSSKTQYVLVDYTTDSLGSAASYTPPACTGQSGSRTMYSNGNHNMCVADVDGDGLDEIIWGSAALDHDGRLLYATGFGHGDALHVGPMIPGRNGLQVFQVHEEKGTYAWDLHDAATGQILYKGGPSGVDNGRGMAAQLSAKSAEWWFSSAAERQQRSAVTGQVASTANGSVNFRMYWDATPQDALLDGNKLDAYSDATNSFSRLATFYNIGPGSTCNGTKNTPNLLADLFGDWREELILHTVTDQEAYLGIYTTNIPTPYAVPTLMHDHTYRMAVCWQNTAYNQPPHLGYNLAQATDPRWEHIVRDTTVAVGQPVDIVLKARNTQSVDAPLITAPDGSAWFFEAPPGFQLTAGSRTLAISGTPAIEGDYQFLLQLSGLGNQLVDDSLTIHVQSAVGIVTAAQPTPASPTRYDLSGRKATATPHRGLFLERRHDGTIRKIIVR